MIFDAILDEIVNGCGGGIAAALMGNDGISIAEVVSDREADARESLGRGDRNVAGAEFGRILAEIGKASDASVAARPARDRSRAVALHAGLSQRRRRDLPRSSRSRRMATSARRAISSVGSCPTSARSSSRSDGFRL